MVRSALLVLILALIACAPSREDGLHADAPGTKLDAIVQSGRDRDQEAIPALVDQLDSDDPAVRMMAIEALRRLTNNDMGYNPYAPPGERRAATQRWVRAVRGGERREEGEPSGPPFDLAP